MPSPLPLSRKTTRLHGRGDEGIRSLDWLGSACASVWQHPLIGEYALSETQMDLLPYGLSLVFKCESQNLSAPPEAPQSSLNKTVEAVALLLPPQRPPNLLLTTQPRLLPLRLPSSGLVSYVKRKAPTPGSLMLH
ncbi:hypothetical protein BHM03_00009102 [Ensete ventricosum]|nr:hypothetical protein BHM03_00009102 [Ensete ventricosum]